MKVFSAYCGTGKTTTCQTYEYCTEIECWKFSDSNKFPNNIIKEIFIAKQRYSILFISTNKIVLDALKELHIKPILIYPQRHLKDEYMKRYISRDNEHKDFLEVMERYWDGWITELEQIDNEKFILGRGQYILNHPKLKTIIEEGK